jgi:lipopolysaccharide export system permease protein
LSTGRTLHRYLLREVGGAFLAAVGLAVSVLFVLRIVEFVDLAFARGVPARLVGALAGYIVPSYLEIALPMGALLAVVVVFARLGSDGELLAMRASGLALPQLARPLVSFSVAVATVSLVLGVWARPWANRGIEQTTYEMARTRLTASLRAGVFNTWFGGVILFVDELDAASGGMRNVMLAEEREEYGRKTIFANRGRVESNEDARTAYLELREGSLLTYHPSGKVQDKTDFDSLELNLDLAEERGLDLMDNGGPSAMSLERLLAERRAAIARGEAAIEETIELHRKLVLPAAALLLPFIGVPLGSVGRRGVKSRGLLLSTLVVLAYYLALTGAVTVARQQVVPTALAMWTPDAVLAALAFAMFRREAAEKSLAPSWRTPPRRPVS